MRFRGEVALLAAVLAVLLAGPAAAREPVISYVDEAGVFRLYDEQTETEVEPPPPVPAGFPAFRWGMSLDGRYIVFNDADKKLHLLDRATNTEVPLPGIDVDANPGGLTVSNTGLIGFDSNGNGPTRVYDSVGKGFVETGLGAANEHRQPKLSGDGRFLATTCREGCVVDDMAEDSDVYVQDLATRLDTGFPDDLGGAGKDEEHPCINGDGSVVATDIFVGGQRDVFRYDRGKGELIGEALDDPAADEIFCVLDSDARNIGFFHAVDEFKVLSADFADQYLNLPPGKPFGLFSTFSSPYTPPPAPPGTGPIAGADVTAPVLGAFRAARRVFRVGPDPTPTVAQRRRARVGTTFRWRLSEPGTVTITIERYARGRRVGTRCRRPTARNRARRRCNRLVQPRSLIRRSRPAGPGSTAFSGRVGRRALRPARYRATITATDAAGNSSRPRRLTFRIVR